MTSETPNLHVSKNRDTENATKARMKMLFCCV